MKKINKLQSSYYRNVSTDPLGSGHRSLEIGGAHFGNFCRWSKVQPCLNRSFQIQLLCPL